MCGAHSLFEHRNQCVLDVRWGARGIEEIRRSAGLQRRRNIRNIVIGVNVFAVGESGCVLNCFVRNIENGDRYSAIFHRRTIIGGSYAVWRYDGGRILVGNLRSGRPVL